MVHDHTGAPRVTMEDIRRGSAAPPGWLGEATAAGEVRAVLLYAVQAACSPHWSPLAPARWLAESEGLDPATVRTALEELRQANGHPARWRTRALATLTIALADLETRGAGPEGAAGTAPQPVEHLLPAMPLGGAQPAGQVSPPPGARADR